MTGQDTDQSALRCGPRACHFPARCCAAARAHVRRRQTATVTWHSARAWHAAFRLRLVRRFLLRLGGKRIESDVDDIIVEQTRRLRQREGELWLYMCEGGTLGTLADDDRNDGSLGRQGDGIYPFADHGNTPRHLDGTGSAGGADEDPSLDTDLDRHQTRIDMALARRVDDHTLIADVERGGFAFTRLAA